MSHVTSMIRYMYQAELKFVSADMYSSSIILITDIDECSDGSDDCDDKALCENTEGSHTCTCNQGYSGTGLICTGMYLTSHVYI